MNYTPFQIKLHFHSWKNEMVCTKFLLMHYSITVQRRFATEVPQSGERHGAPASETAGMGHDPEVGYGSYVLLSLNMNLPTPEAK